MTGNFLWHMLAVARSIRRLGMFNASKLALSRRLGGTWRIRMRGYSDPFQIRGRSSDAWVFQQLIVSQQYADGLQGRSFRKIVDAGANAGYASRYFKQRWPDAEIVMIEPDPDNARVASANLERMPGVTLIEAGLWASRGQANFVAAYDQKYALRLQAHAGGTVEMVGVEDVLDRMGWDRVDLLKMDIEGAEREVFGPGARSWIGRVGVLAVELHESVAPGCTKRLFEALAEVDFTLHWRGENLFVYIAPTRASGPAQ